eukprot:TRINITY_DN14424_c0_g1_i1.p1 TRINITY_DN14424_c0_g1~~TRINITY_DN14424_c0_g1_i1.p1  ORF type:complete len:525 (+),score=80.42 TRINITY_DN14424_c0_g1_i1:817-2391(+)
MASNVAPPSAQTPWVAVPMETKPCKLGDPSVGFTVAANSKLMIVFGGTADEGRDDQVTNALYLFDVEEKQWRVPQHDAWDGISPSGRQGAVLVPVEDNVYICGGFATTNLWGPVLRDTWMYNITGNKWTKLPDSPVPFAGGSGVADRDRGSLLIFGGTPDPKEVLLQFDTPTCTWRVLSYTGAGGPAQRSDHVAEIYDGKMFIFGGQMPPSWISTDDFWAFDTVLSEWSRLDKAGDSRPCRRFGHASCVYRDSMYVFGGCASPSRNSYLADIHRFDFKTGVWRQLLFSNLPTPGRVLASFVIEDSIFINDDELFELKDDTHQHQAKRETIPFFSDYTNSQEYHDVVLLVHTEGQNVEMYAHKVVLARCSYLKRLIDNAWLGDREMTTSSVLRIVMEDEELNPVLCTLLLQFIYSGDVRTVAWAEVAALYDLAAKWTFAPLVEACRMRLRAQLTADTVFQLLALASKHSDKLLKEDAVLFVLDNKQELNTESHKRQLASLLQCSSQFALEFASVFFLVLGECKER